MAKKLSKKKAQVWDRLKNGIQPPRDPHEIIEDMIATQLAKEIKDEIDKEILDSLIKSYNNITVNRNESYRRSRTKSN